MSLSNAPTRLVIPRHSLCFRAKCDYVLLLVFFFLAFSSAPPAEAQPIGADCPRQPIRIVVPSGAGSPSDVITRIVAQAAKVNDGQLILVENSSTVIAGGAVLRRPRDGSTIMSASLPVLTASLLSRRTNYNLQADFLPIIKLSTSYNVLVVSPTVRANSFDELVALLRTTPDAFNYSSGGFGTPAHLLGELLNAKLGVRLVHVPYKALPHAINDLLNGTNHLQFITPIPVLGLIASGKLRALAVAGPGRVAALKDVPTVGEFGYPDLILQDWNGYFLARGTPLAFVACLNQMFNTALLDPRVKEALEALGSQPAGGSVEEFGDFITSQLAHLDRVTDTLGMRAGR